MTAKHTPGPWAFRKHWTDSGAFEVYPTRGGKPDVGQWSGLAEVCEMEKRGESRANARLIAAAPDLLEALRGLLCCVADDDEEYGPDHRVTIARSAIKKATGGAK